MKIKYSGKFKKELKLAKKQNKNLQALQTVLQYLINKEPLPQKYNAHNLTGNYINHKECHITPDWLLIYKYEDEYLVLYRLGSHSELFNK